MAFESFIGPDEGWYQELNLEFPDGGKQQFYLEVTRTGRRIPVAARTPAPWTKLEFHKCPGCPLAEGISRCPAAVSLEGTLAKLKSHASTEVVRVTAVDGKDRTVSVQWPLQQVGGVLVQLAAFASGCPVGDRMRPYLKDLRLFSTTKELTRHVVGKVLLRHRGDLEATKASLPELMNPLREVFKHLLERLRAAQHEDDYGDAAQNSIIHLDAFAQIMTMGGEEICDQLAAEVDWTPLPGECSPKPRKKGLWERLNKGLFG